MGTSADQTLKEIDATRANLQNDLQALFNSLPEAANGLAGEVAGQWGPKILGGLGAVAVAGLAARSRASRSRAKKAQAAQRRSARIQAEELARAFGSLTGDGRPVGGPLAPPPEDQGKGGKGKLGLVLLLALAAGGAAAFLAGRD